MLKKRNLSFNEKKIFYEKVSINFNKTKKEVVNYFLLDNVYLKVEFVCSKDSDIRKYFIELIKLLITKESSKYFDFKNFSNILNFFDRVSKDLKNSDFSIYALNFKDFFFFFVYRNANVLISQKLFLKVVYALLKSEFEIFRYKKYEENNFVFGFGRLLFSSKISNKFIRDGNFFEFFESFLIFLKSLCIEKDFFNSYIFLLEDYFFNKPIIYNLETKQILQIFSLFKEKEMLNIGFFFLFANYYENHPQNFNKILIDFINFGEENNILEILKVAKNMDLRDKRSFFSLFKKDKKLNMLYSDLICEVEDFFSKKQMSLFCKNSCDNNEGSILFSGGFLGRGFIRIITKKGYFIWEKAFFLDWKSYGFDYIPIENIFNLKKDTFNILENDVKIFNSKNKLAVFEGKEALNLIELLKKSYNYDNKKEIVFDENNHVLVAVKIIGESLDIFNRRPENKIYLDLILKEQDKIIKVLEKNNIKKPDHYLSNVCVEITLDKKVRCYLIDWD